MRSWLLLRLLPLLFGQGLAAPRTDSRSGISDNVNITNPFTSGEEHLSILQGYLQDKDPLGENDTKMTRETAILRLFVLHDYDKSGLLDGLELMQLLYGILTKDRQEKPTEDAVILMVDDVLETQDINLDGLLCAQELLNSVKDKESFAPAHIVIPPPMGVPVEELPAPVDNDLSNIENSDQPEPQHQQAQDNNVPSDHIDEPAIPPAETMSSQEEPDEVQNEDVVEEEVTNDVEAVEMPGEEEDDKPDDEM